MEKKSADQTAALERITTDQTAASNKSSEELARALESLGKSSSNIKPTQPHFKPLGTLEDYLKYKEFEKAFEFFIKRVPKDEWGEKVEWLRRSVHNGADTIISACESNQAGYNKCFELLDKKYKNKDLIMESIFDYMVKFNISNTGKAHINLSDKMVALSNHIEELKKSPRASNTSSLPFSYGVEKCPS